MNSLVVFLSVVALVAGKPSGLLEDAGILAYSSPIIAAAPAAVSHQSRLDIKSSPALVATKIIPPIARIAEPALIATPAIATAAIAPAAVSSQSRIDISGPIRGIPLISYSAPFSYGTSLAYKAPFYAGAVAPAFLKTSFGAPALYKTAAAEWAPAYAASATFTAGPTVPLDTPEVIAARAAHFEAKALTRAHQIHKRSAPLIASPLLPSPIISTYAATPIYSSVHATPLAYSTPIGYSSPLFTKTLSVHPW